jgi:hypothetical protein
MPIGLGASLGIGGGRSSTSSGAPGGGGGSTPFANTLSGLFDGGDNLDTAAITLTGAKAVSLWAKCSANWISGNGPKLIAATGGDWFPHVAYGQYLYAKGTNNSGTAGSSQFQALGSGFYVLNNWYHFVITSDGTTMSYYANNATVGGAAAAVRGTDINVDPQSLNVIGGFGVNFQASCMDEIAMWDVELSAAQVTNIYRGESNGGSDGTNGTPGDLSTFNAASGTGPLHWWRFGDGTGDVNASGGTPANTGVIGTLVDQGSGGKNATQTTASEQPTFSNVLPA